MVADTMIPEAFERTHLSTGLSATMGLEVALAIEKA
jgi:ZIP family zinc transporter